jgi:hypothetical protein
MKDDKPMLKDLLADSAKQFEERFPLYAFKHAAYAIKAKVKSYHLARISSAFALGEQSGIKKAVEGIRWSWDIAEGTDQWCVQIWDGNTLLDSITKKSDDGGMVKLSEAFQSNLTTKK